MDKTVLNKERQDWKTDLIEFKNIGFEADSIPFITMNILRNTMNDNTPTTTTRNDNVPLTLLIQNHQPPFTPIQTFCKLQPEITAQIKPLPKSLQSPHLYGLLSTLLHPNLFFFFSI